MRYVVIIALLFTTQAQAAPWNGDQWANSLVELNIDVTQCAQFPEGCNAMALLKRLKTLSGELMVATGKHPGTNSIVSFKNDIEHFSSVELADRGFNSLILNTNGMKYIHEQMAVKLKRDQAKK